MVPMARFEPTTQEVNFGENMAKLDFNYLIKGQLGAGNFDEFVSAITSSSLLN